MSNSNKNKKVLMRVYFSGIPTVAKQVATLSSTPFMFFLSCLDLDGGVFQVRYPPLGVFQAMTDSLVTKLGFHVSHLQRILW